MADKTLGQIAREASGESGWEVMAPSVQAHWERIAHAVAEAVRGEEKAQHGLTRPQMPPPSTQQEIVEGIMHQAQVFASAWSLVGGRFDRGEGLQDAEAAKAELKQMVLAALAAAEAVRGQDAPAGYMGALAAAEVGLANLISYQSSGNTPNIHEYGQARRALDSVRAALTLLRADLRRAVEEIEGSVVADAAQRRKEER